MSTVTITVDDLSDGSVFDLLQAHRTQMFKYSPPESIHALDESKLKDPCMTFWAARINNKLVACGGLKENSASSAEIKSMKTYPEYLRRGIAEQLLDAIILEARQRSYSTIYLETGSHEAFLPAIRMYVRE